MGRYAGSSADAIIATRDEDTDARETDLREQIAYGIRIVLRDRVFKSIVV